MTIREALETVDRLQISAQFVTPVGVEEDVDAGASANTHVVVALGANVQGLFQLRAVQHRVAGWALVPQTFRNRAFLHLGTHDRRDQFVY